jgi:hypothetical protein
MAIITRIYPSIQRVIQENFVLGMLPGAPREATATWDNGSSLVRRGSVIAEAATADSRRALERACIVLLRELD